ncbi:stage II sporulation protein M [Anaerolentibacter hominis]|uniref:stage II sporulation protein M n=1 Tax=Anaerolentibacter hominis TaxID=3079009 RepID=UPI0031B7F443
MDSRKKFALFFGGALILGVVAANLLKGFYLESFLSFCSAYDKDSGAVISQPVLLRMVLVDHLKWYLIFWLICMTHFLSPLLGIWSVYKGFCLGFVLGGEILILGFKGIVQFLLLIFPHYLIYIPFIYFLFGRGIRFNKRKSRWIEEVPAILLLFILMVAGCFLEAYGNPLLYYSFSMSV